MGEIKNTAKEEVHPEWLFGGNSSAIENQEAQGQTQFVESMQLPTEIRGKEILEKAGVKFGEPCPDDPIFCNAELPKGWKKQATDHSMWSDLVDENGTIRAQIFYKAAFYDRNAHMDAVEKE